MIKITGKYNTADIFADTIEETAANQIQMLCDQEFVKDCTIRIMPDVHAGAGCVIGFTADLGSMIIPNIVGVDIGCGMLTVELGKIEVDFLLLDQMIHTLIPSGQDVHPGRIAKFPQLQQLNCYRNLHQTRWIERSLGTLGGGNHFIEIDSDDEQNKYLIIHTGSRNLGKQVAEHYQQMAFDICRGADQLFENQKKLIEDYKSQGRRNEIQSAIIQMRSDFQAKETTIPKEMCYLTGEYREQYLHDMKICQDYASQNRMKIASILLNALFNKKMDDFKWFETIHNYIDHESNIVRKGSVSAKSGEKLLIPINMRDGSLLCIGKGNKEWNCSAPHGAGRLFSRKKAKETFTLEEFQTSMNGIYSSSINESTLDESPMAYKSMAEILNQITPTADVLKILKPLYNFKSSN